MTLPWHEVSDLSTDGSITETGGGFIGGGFGVSGAIQGIVAAEVLNKMMRQTHVNSFVHIAGPNGETALHSRMPAGHLRFLLGPAIAEFVHRPVEQSTGGDALERLERLALLRTSGAIDEAEYGRLKAQILNGM